MPLQGRCPVLLPRHRLRFLIPRQFHRLLCLPRLHLLGQDAEQVLEARHARDFRLVLETPRKLHKVGYRHGDAVAFRHALTARPYTLREDPAVVAGVPVEQLPQQAPVLGRETPFQLQQEVLDHVVEKPFPRQHGRVPVDVRKGLVGRLVLHEQLRIAVQCGLQHLRPVFLDVERAPDPLVEYVALDRLAEGLAR